MTLVDTNVLVYAAFAGTPEHGRAREWLDDRLADADGAVAFCWPVLHAYVRLASNPRTFGASALAVPEAWADVDALLRQPAARIVTHGVHHSGIAGELAATAGLRSEDVPDVEIAALAIENGLALATHDSGFRRFARLRVVDPVAGEG